jgi:phthiocerol/phenolphthiocerol synthesis type-I polyketide synthase E
MSELQLEPSNSAQYIINAPDSIAIVSMAGRFPGANTLDRFWQNLRDGVESIATFSDAELLAAGVELDTLHDPNYVKAGSALDNIEEFDATFFGFNPREAEITDPQHRLFLECCWEALERAGYNPENYTRKIGLYAGVTLSSYLFANLYANPHMFKSVDRVQALIGNDKDHLSTQISYKLNLRGPSITVQTTCSTSLVAVHLACQGLLNGDCDSAIAGGVSIQVPQIAGYYYQAEGIYSPDGHCRAFDAKAQGTVFGNGLGVVVLKRLEDALTDGDQIQAVIRGSAINNDGAAKVGYTAPSVEGQREVIAEALAIAGVHPETITYVETHGTGTALGDPIELAALTQAFARHTQQTGFCAIASVKTNIGHLNTAAGVAGLIKTVLALQHQQIPPSLNLQAPNPQIDFANTPFYVNTSLTDWSSNGSPRRAGVSSFGIGGTNAHVILEEAPAIAASSPSRPWQLLLLSAKTSSALEQTTTNLAEHLAQHPNINLADVAQTLQVGRRTFEHRRLVVCESTADAIQSLTTLDLQRVVTGHQLPVQRSMVWMFPGQGAQSVNMAASLYQTEPTFRQQVDRCADVLKSHLGLDIRSILYPIPSQIEEATQQVQQTAIAQPALFVIEYALAQLWLEWGIRPTALIGHSVGEYVAATLAGVFSLEDALSVVATRGKLMQALPPGRMVAVLKPEHEVRPFLSSKLSCAAINSPSTCVISGPTEAIEAFQVRLAEHNIDSRSLWTSHAFHSAMMQPILEPFELALQRVRRQPPQIPFMSNLTGTWITAEAATDPRYWIQHLRQTVQFSSSLLELLQQPNAVFLEVGPGRTLSTLAKQHVTPTSNHPIFNSLRHPDEPQSDLAGLLKTLGHLWMSGVTPNWSGFYTHEHRQRLPLPTYPFERQRYWIEPTPSLSVAPTPHLPDPHHSRPNLNIAYVAPATELEEQIAVLWQTILGIERVGINDSFFELGGDSLLATQLLSRLQAIFPIELSLRDLLVQVPTVTQQANLIDQLLLQKVAELSDAEAAVLLAGH